MSEYEINIDTIAIIPKGGATMVVEKDGDFFVENRVYDIMDNSCKYFGSSLVGRQEGTKKMINVTHKSPIIVEESSGLVFFPTHSPVHKDCSWLNVNNLVHYQKSSNDNKTLVIFNNGISLEFDVRYGSMNNQILRAARLVNVLQTRRVKKNNLNKVDVHEYI